jgi:hypothetical protein
MGPKKSTIFYLIRCCRLMMLLSIGRPTTTIQLIVCVIPIDTLDGSDRLGEWLCAGLVREHDSGAVNLHGSADLVGWASQVLINL